MKIRHVVTIAVGTVLLAVLCAACAKSASTSPETEALKTAIARYLDEHSMGMRVAEVREVKVQGTAAEALVTMEQADGVVGLKVRWNFWFERRPTGWVALRYEPK